MFNFNDPEIIDALNAGGVVVLPTDTVYGLCARASDEKAVSRLYALKNRLEKPGTIIAESIDQLVELGIKRRYLSAASDFWPGKISVEIPHDIDYLNQNTGRQAFRIVNDKKLIGLLNKTGPLLTSSANLPGQPPANNISEAKAYFGPQVDAYVNGGDLSDRKPSTLIRVVDDAIEVMREGEVKVHESGEVGYK